MTPIPPRPARPDDLSLEGILTITDKEVVIDYGFGMQAYSRVSFERVFKNKLGLHVLNGTFNIDVSSREKNFGVTDPADVYTPEEWDLIMGDGGGLRKLLMGHLLCLGNAYRGQLVEEEFLDVVRAAIERALLQDENPLKGIHLPTQDELVAMVFEGGCASCAFCEKGTSFLAKMPGEKPPLRKDMSTAHGVNVRAIREKGRIRIVVGYLDHENPFKEAFHNALVARLQPLLTPELIRSVISDLLVNKELDRRTLTRRIQATMETYGFDCNDISALADGKEMQAKARGESVTPSEPDLPSDPLVDHFVEGGGAEFDYDVDQDGDEEADSPLEITLDYIDPDLQDGGHVDEPDSNSPPVS